MLPLRHFGVLSGRSEPRESGLSAPRNGDAARFGAAGRGARALRGVLLALAVLGFGTIAALPACSSSACDDSKCAAGNKCVDNGHGTACRLLCDTQAVCPFNYQCMAAPNGTTFCNEDTTKYVQKKDKGQWGASCNPPGGIDSNPDCDTDQTFWCYAKNPGDGNAYCTQYQCTKDTDCGPGMWCGTINNAPSATSKKRSFGADQTTTVCLKREYCAPCTADVDCPSTNGIPSHCVPDSSGTTKFCTEECSSTTGCRPDATCQANDAAGGAQICFPRAGTCKGDGSLCSPCYSDADCPNGFCGEQTYTHERFCTVKSDVPCAVVNGKLQANCPKPNQAGVDESCITSNDDPDFQKDQCVGLVQFGTSSGQPVILPACWTAPRK